MAIRAYDGVAPIWYTPESERGQTDAAEFHLRPMTGPELLDTQQFYDMDKGEVKTPALVAAARNGLIGWRNVVDGVGKELVFVRTGINRLPAEVVAELGGEVFRISSLDEDDAKNSSSQ